MKKTVSLILALSLVLCIMAGCGSAAGSGSSSAGSTEDLPADTVTKDLDAAKTIGDLMAMDSVEETATANYDDYFVYVFTMDGTDYRAVCELTPEQAESLWSVDFEDENYEEKYRELAAPLEITRIDNLTASAPSQDELDALTGKTGQELMDAGWMTGGYNADTMEFFMNYKEYAFIVIFDGEFDQAAAEENGEDEAIKNLVVKSVAYNGIGDGTYLEEMEDTEEIEETEDTEATEE